MAVIFLLAFAVYSPVLTGQFVWDDALLIDKNPLVTGQLGLGSIWFHTDFPLTLVAFWAQWLVWGNNPIGYHVVNVLLHGLNAVLVWRVLVRLKIPRAWFAAVLFAVHPVCVGSVAWISELKNTLSLPFFLLSLYWYMASESQVQSPKAKSQIPMADDQINCELEVEDEEEKPRSITSTRTTTRTSGLRGSRSVVRSLVDSWSHNPVALYWWSLCAFVLALLAKTSTVMLPVVLVACAWWQQGRITKRDLARTSRFFILALVFGLMTISFQAHGAMGDKMVQTENFWGRLAGAGIALWFYLGKALLPLNLNLVYPRWQMEAGVPLSYLPLLSWCGVLALAWRFRHSWGRPVLFGVGCFTVTMFPVLGFLDMYYLALSRVSDHFQYLPMIAILALVSASLQVLGQRWPHAKDATGAKVPDSYSPLRPLPPLREGPLVLLWGLLLVLGLSALTFHRAQLFANAETLWRETLAKNPASWSAHNNLGTILARQHNYDEAQEHFLSSLHLNSDNAQAHSNLGAILAQEGRFLEAQSHFVAALKIKPGDADIHWAYATALVRAGKMAEGLDHAHEALRLEPGMTRRRQLAALLVETGHSREAIAEYREILRVTDQAQNAYQAERSETMSNLAWLLATSQDPTLRNGPEAVRLAERACQLTKYTNGSLVAVLAAAYAEAGRFKDAVTTAEKAVEMATAAGNMQLAVRNQELAELYRAGKPYHEPEDPSPKSQEKHRDPNLK